MDDMHTPLSVRFSLILHRFRSRIRFYIGSRLPDRGIAWKKLEDYEVPICPRCGEYVYHAKQCSECGQHFLNNTVTIGSVLDHGR